MSTYVLETINAEIDECIELLRPHYPNATDEELRRRAEAMRDDRYRKGHWPSAKEIRKRRAEELIAEKLAATEAAE